MGTEKEGKEMYALNCYSVTLLWRGTFGQNFGQKVNAKPTV